MGAAEAPKKPTMPSWLRAELLKRGLGPDGAAASKKKDSDSDEERGQPAKHRRKFSDVGPGSRWQDQQQGQKGGNSSDSDTDAEDAERMMRINNEIKRLMTQLLLTVTDTMFDDIADEALAAAAGPPPKPVPVAGVVILNTDGNSPPSRDVLGLGYGSSSDSDEEDAASSPPQAEQEAAAKEDQAAGEEGGPGAMEQPPVKEDDSGLSAKDDAAKGLAQSSDEVSKDGMQADAVVVNASDPQEHGGGAPAVHVQSDSSKSSITKGSRVWYLDRIGTRRAATVEDVDTTHPPPSYTIRLDGAASTRSTEIDRLFPLEEGPNVEPQAGEDQGTAAPEVEAQKTKQGHDDHDGGNQVPLKEGVFAVETKVVEQEGRPNLAGSHGAAEKAAKEKSSKSRKDVERQKEKQSVGDKDKEREREREKENEKLRERDRAKEEDRAREREKEKQKEKERQREKERPRERDREKEREKDRKREAQRDRGRRERRSSSRSARSSDGSRSRSRGRRYGRHDSKREMSRERKRHSSSRSRSRSRRPARRTGRENRSRSMSPGRRQGHGGRDMGRSKKRRAESPYNSGSGSDLSDRKSKRSKGSKYSRKESGRSRRS